MKYVDEYRDPVLARALVQRIHALSRRPVRFMEICGTHTMAIFRHGIRSLLPATIDLVSGPGCPVCVTAMEDIDRAILLARVPGLIVTTFGDMLRVPGSTSSLQEERASGADVRIVHSALDALGIAGMEPKKEVVFLGVGFETTAPTVAAAIKTARDRGVTSVSVLPLHKLLPPALEALLSPGDLGIDGFLCPGHVTTVIGTGPYEEVVRKYRIPCVVTGFEPLDILQGILMLVSQVQEGRAEVENQYRRGVTARGNPAAVRMMEEVYAPGDALWRGLGPIPLSGLRIRKAFEAHDAARRYVLTPQPSREPPGCLCAEVLRGRAKPPDCRLFRRGCSPMHPVGPCMVSSEGTCAAYFKYHGA